MHHERKCIYFLCLNYLNHGKSIPTDDDLCLECTGNQIQYDPIYINPNDELHIDYHLEETIPQSVRDRIYLMYEEMKQK